jgi:hypothetical protein
VAPADPRAQLGASAGLNLRADRVRITWPGGAVGPLDSPLVLENAWVGGPMPPVGDPEVVERVGCDLAPVDITTTEGRLHLTSFVWPDQPERFERLRDAFAVAVGCPAQVVQGDLVEHLRSLRPQPGTVLLVWHSSTWMYLDSDERASASVALAELAALATADSPVVHVAREYLDDRLGTGFALVTQWWPAPPAQVASGIVAGAEIQHADTPAHGLPVTWIPQRLLTSQGD